VKIHIAGRVRMKHNDLELVIRDAEESDSDSVAILLQELGYRQTSSFVAKKIRKLSKRIKDRIIVAVKKSQVVGVVSLHILPLLHQKGNLCRVTAIAVSKNHRGEHIGRRLMEVTEAYAKSNKCFKVEITSGDYRSDAHTFYQKLGYKEVSRRFVKILETSVD